MRKCPAWSVRIEGPKGSRRIDAPDTVSPSALRTEPAIERGRIGSVRPALASLIFWWEVVARAGRSCKEFAADLSPEEGRTDSSPGRKMGSVGPGSKSPAERSSVPRKSPTNIRLRSMRIEATARIRSWCICHETNPIGRRTRYSSRFPRSRFAHTVACVGPCRFETVGCSGRCVR